MSCQFLVKKLYPDATIPARGSEGAAGYDVCAYLKGQKTLEDCPHINFRAPKEDEAPDLIHTDGKKLKITCTIKAGTRLMIPTGLQMAVPPGYYIRVAPRSGLAYKHGIDVFAGVVDSDYRGEARVILFNSDTEDFVFTHGDRIAQLIIEKIETPGVQEVTELPDTVRGAGGFGSTGK